MKSENLLLKLRRDVRCPVQKQFLADLLRSQYLFKILQTPLAVRNSEDVAKGGCLEKRLRWRGVFFKEIV